MADAGEDKDAVIQQLRETVSSLKQQLKATKAENARLKRVNMRQTAAKTGRAVAKKQTGEESGGGKKKKAVRSTSSRLYNPAKLRQKQAALQKAKEETELANCSFRPRTSTGTPPKSTSSKQATNRLFQQAKVQQKKREALRSKREKEEIESCTFSPVIDSKSAKIAKTKPGEDTFSRLAVPVKHAVNENGMDDKDLIECTFTPKLINPQRSGSTNQVATHDRLYAEAILRKAKQEQIRKAKDDKERVEELDGCTFAPKVNTNSEFAPNTNAENIVERLYTKDLEKRTQKMSVLQRQVAKEFSFQPKVKKNKNYQTANGDIIERLYETSRLQKDDEAPLDPECTFAPEITSLASEIERGDLPTHERLALEMSPSQKIALADMEDYYEDDEEYYGEEDYEGEEEEYEEGEEEEDDDMEEIDEDEYEEEEEEYEEDEEDIELP